MTKWVQYIIIAAAIAASVLGGIGAIRRTLLACAVSMGWM